MRSFLKEVLNNRDSIITAQGKLIIGDFNIHIEGGNDANAKTFLDLLQGFGLINHVWQPTHISGNTVDLIITNDEISL